MRRSDQTRDTAAQTSLGLGGVRRVLRDAWEITYPYWLSEERRAARGLLLAVLSLNLATVYLNVLLNKWMLCRTRTGPSFFIN